VFYSREEHYADSSVTVYFPPAWHPEGKVDLVFFFHGWMSSREEAVSDFDLLDQFRSSGTKALLVVPETAYRSPDSFGGKFEEAGGFAHFVGDLLDALDASSLVPGARLGTIVLAGHSGGYRIIASILRRGGLETRIGEVWLFDALYARQEAFADWISSGHRGRFICITSMGGDTANRAQELATLLEARGVPFVRADEEAALDSSFLRSPVIFIVSEEDHYGLVRERGEFRAFLSSSSQLAKAVAPLSGALEIRSYQLALATSSNRRDGRQ
jgi:fermentation-respiration switch protein FrsA (DUF1100 family)